MCTNNDIGEHREVEKAVFDFSAVSLEDVEAFDYNELAISTSRLNSSLRLMGVRPIYGGFIQDLFARMFMLVFM
ncbi:hypothetical protein [Psychrobacillus sp. BM2]|uniref:hypothetical protein n=1 Tax=Psychrobacillus sp. BM2 TaxID=3400421 RepID=UPI003B01C4AF